MTIKLSDALKLQRKIIENQKSNQKTIIKNNSYILGGEVYKIKKLEEEQQNLKEDLIKLKLAIRNANTDIVEDIFTLSELKEELKRFEKISTKEGTYLEKELGCTVVYNVHFTREEVKEKLRTIIATKREIEAKLENYNKNIELTLEFKSNLLNKTTTD